MVFWNTKITVEGYLASKLHNKRVTSQISDIVRTKMTEPQRHLKQFLLTSNLCMKDDSMKRSPQGNFWTKKIVHALAQILILMEINLSNQKSKKSYEEQSLRSARKATKKCTCIDPAEHRNTAEHLHMVFLGKASAELEKPDIVDSLIGEHLNHYTSFTFPNQCKQIKIYLL